MKRIENVLKQYAKKSHIPQTGRTMTEMLGVLAIIGILSIIALVSYQYAMAKRAANETINELNIRLVDVTHQIHSGTQEIKMEMGDLTKESYKVDAWRSTDRSDRFYLALENVPSAVCKHILNMGWKAPIGIFVGDDLYMGNDDICGEKSKLRPMDFEFAINLEGAGGEPVDPADPCAKKPLKGYWEGECWSCDHPGNILIWDLMSNCTSACPNREIVDGMYCVPQTCSDDYPLKSLYGDGCHSCDYSYSVYLGTANIGDCAKCPNRTVVNNAYCALKCPDDKPLQDMSGNCYSCEHNASYFRSSNCEVCPNRDVVGNYCLLACPDEKPVRNSSGTCYACDYESSVNVKNVTNNGCDKCSNREILNDTYCALKECPPEKPLRNSSGNCYACDSTTTLTFATAAEAQACVDLCTSSSIPRWSKDKACYSCAATTYQSGVYPSNATCASMCTAAGYPRITFDGNWCVSCNGTSSYYTNAQAQSTVNQCKALGVLGFTKDQYYYPCSTAGTITYTTEELAQKCAADCNGMREAVGLQCKKK